MEFSKKIFYMLFVLSILVIAYSMALMWVTQDASALAYLIPSVLTMLATGVGFYYWKSKAENIVKLKKQAKDLGLDVSEEELTEEESEVYDE